MKTCSKGHKFKHKNCIVCPICSEELLKTESNQEFEILSTPAQRALVEANVRNLNDLKNWSEKELLKLHGFGSKSIKILIKLLEKNGLSFKNQSLK